MMKKIKNILLKNQEFNVHSDVVREQTVIGRYEICTSSMAWWVIEQRSRLPWSLKLPHFHITSKRQIVDMYTFYIKSHFVVYKSTHSLYMYIIFCCTFYRMRE